MLGKFSCLFFQNYIFPKKFQEPKWLDLDQNVSPELDQTVCIDYDSRRHKSHKPLVNSAYQKNDFLISQPKQMFWVLKRTVSMRRFFWAPKTYAKTVDIIKYLQFDAENFCLSQLAWKVKLLG